ncbi:MAG: trypsin-like serine protease, partial [Alphaproteobacteria bacterium]|nr:trypsin-like serine protease [Alphaproteobacteria bacterium]
MHKLLSSFLVLSMLCHSVFAATGQVDDRVYVNWSDHEYHKVVVFIQPNGYCTGQYVAPNIILTARHCITPDNIDSYGIELYDGRATLVSLLSYGSGQMFRSDGDWAFLLVSDPKFYSDTYFNVARKATPKMTINNTGFGALRILSNAELAQLRQIFSSQRNKMAAESNTNADMIQFSQIFKLVEDDIANLGIPSIMETDNVLKTHFNCEFLGLSQGNMWSTCDIYSGNSGGPYYMGETLYGTCSGAVHRFDNKDKSAAIPSQSFYKELQRIISENPPA